MKITKVLNTSIDLLNPDDIYTPDIDTLLIKKLEERYLNKCYQSVLIIKISKIIRHSSIHMVDNRLDGGAYVDVEFEIEGVIFVQGEILNGCKIIEIHANAITAEHQYAGIKLQKDQSNQLIFKILNIGQKIPIIVQKVRYMPNQSTISMLASPYVPKITEDVYYKISTPLTPKETEELHYMLEQVSTEEELHKKISEQKSYEFFKNILYPYKVNQKFDQSKKVATLKLKPVGLEIKKLLEIDTGTLVYPQEDNRYNKRLFWSSSDISNIQIQGLLINSSAFAAMADILNKYLLYLQALRGFVEVYPTAEQAISMTAYWSLCNNMKP